MPADLPTWLHAGCPAVPQGLHAAPLQGVVVWHPAPTQDVQDPPTQEVLGVITAIPPTELTGSFWSVVEATTGWLLLVPAVDVTKLAVLGSSRSALY